MLETLRINLDGGEVLTMRWDAAQATAPIETLDHEGRWRPTGYRTEDAGHGVSRAIEIALNTTLLPAEGQFYRWQVLNRGEG